LTTVHVGCSLLDTSTPAELSGNKPHSVMRVANSSATLPPAIAPQLSPPRGRENFLGVFWFLNHKNQKVLIVVAFGPVGGAGWWDQNELGSCEGWGGWGCVWSVLRRFLLTHPTASRRAFPSDSSITLCQKDNFGRKLPRNREKSAQIKLQGLQARGRTRTWCQNISSMTAPQCGARSCGSAG
jgi:hypothetical protein